MASPSHLQDKFIIVGDEHFPVEALAKSLPSQENSDVWIEGRGWIEKNKTPTQQSKNSKYSLKEALKTWDIESSPTVAILGFQELEQTQKAVDSLNNKFPGIHILKLGARRSTPIISECHRSVTWNDFLTDSLDKELRLLAFQDKVRSLRKALENAEHIGILIQGDPDPDSLASALALRKLLRRHSQTATILSFGEATRPENVAMIQLLDIHVEKITPHELKNYDRLVLVDCQPSFFKNIEIKADVILDHHPQCAHNNSYAPTFTDIRIELGATATMMLHYLLAAKIEISQRLATALLYGIKSDTLLLNREVSSLDLEAFVHLYPLINTNTLKRIERPELPEEYLKILQKALGRYEIKGSVVFLPLGSISKEEWVPQAADFALQFKGARWAVAYGVFGDRMIVSARNCGFVEHCGDLFKKIFDGHGVAGGHRSMAKAIIPMKEWRQHFKSLAPFFENIFTA